jgi:hypothetical protein
VAAGRELLVTIQVAVTSLSLKGTLRNEASVSGGGAGMASTTEVTPVNAGPASFGVSQFVVEANGLDGNHDVQAGDHPYGVTTTIDFNTALGIRRPGEDAVAQDAKDIAVTLPLGLLGNPFAAEQCPAVDLTDAEGSLGPGGNYRTSCPPGSRVGTIRFLWQSGVHPEDFPVYNVAPARGYPAELGINAGLAQPIFMYASMIPGSLGYRLRIAAPAILRAVSVEAISMTIFGDPAAQDGTPGSGAFITNPTRCSAEPLTANLEASSWEGRSTTAESTSYPNVAGCNLLQGSAAFDPTVKVGPETTQADTPSGYEVDVTLPQAPNVFGSLATPELKNATVMLPAGVSVSPSAASGPQNALEACTPAQIDLLGTEMGEGHPGGNGSPYDDGLTHASPGHCPEKSRLGTVKVETPLLKSPLEGHVFLAQPQCGGSGQPACTEAAAEEGKIFGLYLEMAGSGVIIKLKGSVEAGGHGAHSVATGLAPGQLRARFNENPQLPFEDLKMVFAGGQRAPLANPQVCGQATTSSIFEPWSAPESGPNAAPSSSFAVTGCANPTPFSPAFLAGTMTPLAGGFSPFTLQLRRRDGEQNLAGITIHTPPGLLGEIAGVARCPEPQASQGTCGPQSLIGHTQVAVGAGSQPLWEPGIVFLTGPYRGAPFGLSIVTPAKAGPFNLGNVVVRASIQVDRQTSALTITSDPLPNMIDGVPLRIQAIDATIDRPGFMFNPTNCVQQRVAATVAGTLASGSAGSSASVSSPFAAAGCKNLPFKPKFTVLTHAKTSKAGGAYLHVKVTSGPGQANIAKVKVDLPVQLPSRLTTLQKACPEAAFNANPASCPAGSLVGMATAVTPVLSSPLSGPAYLVSHGGAAFPDLEIVLQGEGITLVLDGQTNIRRGITSSTFGSVPDAPISTFDLVLPQGPHSALGAIANLCAKPLRMPTALTGQNGAVIKQVTKIVVSGCRRHKARATGKRHAAGRNARSV